MSHARLFWLVVLGFALLPTPAHADGNSGVAEPLVIGCEAGDLGCYLARDGTWRDADVAYEEVVRRGEPHYVRAALEMAIALGGGTAWYWLDRERQVADWDYPSWEQRITLEAWRFDNNPFGINFIWHALSGTGFHVWSRANDLSLLAATGVGFGTSMAWEYLLEFREKISINDALVTTGSGVAIGEFVNWLGRYVNSAPRGDGPGHWLARWTFGLPRAAHNRIDHHRPWRGDAAADELGFRADIWHQFDFTYGFAFARAALAQGGDPEEESLRLHQLRFAGRLAAVPGYLRPGRFQRYFDDGNLPSLSLEIIGDQRGRERSVDLLADTILIGQHRQDIPLPGESGLGRAFTLGTSIAYQYRRERLGLFADRLGILHFPGLAIDAHLVGWRSHLRISARAHADFAGLEALSYERWREAHPDAVEKTILRKQGYYYGWGVSGRLSAELSLPRVTLGARASYGYYDSKEGLDRNQEEVTADVQASDTVLDYEAWLRASPLGRRLYLELRLSHQARRAHLGGFDASEDLRRYGLRVGCDF